MQPIYEHFVSTSYITDVRKHKRKEGRMVHNMSDKKTSNVYDDGNIPDVDLPQNSTKNKDYSNVEPLPESTRPRKDGPGGN